MSIKPKLSAFDLSMIVVSLVIGIGIFRTPAEVASSAQSPSIFFFSWIVGGIVSVFGALTFAEIGGRFAVPGGLYQIFSHAYHPVVALMINWVLLLTMGATFSLVALIGCEYLGPLVLKTDWQTQSNYQWMAIAVILVLALLNLRGIRTGSKVQNALSSLKILLMLIIIATVFFSFSQSPDPPAEPVLSGEANWLSAIGMSLIAVFFSYGGYHQTMNFGADVKNPQRNVSKGILTGMAIIVGLYLLINTAYYLSLGFPALMEAKLVAAETLAVYWGETGRNFVSITIFLSVLGLINAMLMSTPRMYYAMAEDRVLPPIFKQVNPKTQVQEFSLLFFVAISVISLFLLKTFENIMNYIMFIDSLAFAGAAAALFVLRFRDKEKKYVGFRVPLYPVFPVLFVLFLLFVSFNVVLTEPKLALAGFLLLLSGAPLYFGVQWLLNRGK